MSGKIKKKLPVILVCISMFVVFSGIILTLMCTTGLTEIPALYNVRKEETANKENKAVGDNGEALVSASATEGNDVADEDGEKDIVHFMIMLLLHIEEQNINRDLRSLPV